MAQRIDSDHARFKEIVRGRIKRNLRKYMQKGELIGRKGKDTISIPVPHIDLPRFKFGQRQQGGVGQGEGEEGQPMSPEDAQSGPGQAGDQEGQHALETEVTLDELADMLGEELELPRIEPRGQRMVADRIRYVGVAPTGPESLRHFRRTYKQALKRSIAAGLYNPQNPVIVPVRDDKRYRTWKQQQHPESNAVIVYMMDVSGSMGEEQKEMVRIESFWIDTWLQRQYNGIENRYIIHDATAREVDRETFFHTRESGGTMISSAYKLCAEIIEAEYPASEWNIYPFHFSDGDNWSSDDTKQCLEVLRDRLLPVANQFSYGQVDSPYGSGQFIKDLREAFASADNMVLSEIKDRDAIYESIKEFLSRGQ